ncbi:MAG: hypothetical protein IT377_12195 [Polyangiaceae bacterium]|nr:hypothetical protein [Polyangiaceae bacterium]
MKRTLLFIVFVLTLVGQAWGAYPSIGSITWETTHPRYFFDADSLATIRSRLGISPPNTSAPGYVAWAKLKAQADVYVTNIDTSRKWFFVAAAGVLSDSPTYKTPAKTYWVNQVLPKPADGKLWPLASSANEGELFSYVQIGPLGYDWHYADLSAAERASAFAKIQAAKTASPGGDSGGRYYRVADSRWAQLFCAVGDPTDGVAGHGTDTVIADTLNASLSRFVHRNLPCLTQLSPSGKIDSYDGTRRSKIWALRSATKSGSNYDVAAKIDSSAFIQNNPEWVMQRYIGNAHGFARSFDKWNSTQQTPTAYMAYCGSQLGDPYAQSLANELIRNDKWYVQEEYVLVCAWWNPSKAATDFHNAPTSLWVQSDEWYWYKQRHVSPGETQKPWRLQWFLGPVGYATRAPGAMSLSRGEDVLLGSASFYRGEYAVGHGRIMTRPIGKSGTLCIYDPVENYGTIADLFGAATPSPNQAGTKPTLGTWSTKCQKCFLGGAPVLEDQGYVARSLETPTLWRATSDFSNAYATSKTGQVYQDVMFYKPTWTSDGLLMVWHQQTPAKANLPMWTNWWTRNVPTAASGSWTVVEGSYPRGGIFASSDVTSFYADEGSSRLWGHFLTASGGSATRFVRLVGGAAVSGEPYQQSIKPEAQATYDAAEQSYEGRYAHLSAGMTGYQQNFLAGTCNAVAGLCTCYGAGNEGCKAPLAASDINKRKQIDGPGLLGYDSCDWRIELGANVPTSGQVVNLISAFTATPNYVTAGRPVKIYQLADTAAIGFDDGSRLRCFVRLSPRVNRLAAPGDETNTITFDNPFYSPTATYGSQYEELDPGPEITLPATAVDISGGGGSNPLPPGANVLCQVHNLKRSARYAMQVMPGDYTWQRFNTNADGVLEFGYPSGLMRIKVRYDP